MGSSSRGGFDNALYKHVASSRRVRRDGAGKCGPARRPAREPRCTQKRAARSRCGRSLSRRRTKAGTELLTDLPVLGVDEESR